MKLKDKIHTIRGLPVMLDSDLAELYEVETKNLNKAVKRNPGRFPEDFCFTLTEKEFQNLRFQIGTANLSKSRYNPLVFTEHGVTALAGVLRSKIAEEISVEIVREFVTMRKQLSQNNSIFNKFHQIDQKFLEQDSRFDELFRALESNQLTPKQGIFFDGQLYDAHKFIINLISSAKESITLIDTYVTEDTLTLFIDSNAPIIIYTKDISKKLELAVKKFNQQYGEIEFKEFSKSHDRFLIIDEEVYHIGASLKDLGKKWFAFSKMKFSKDILTENLH